MFDVTDSDAPETYGLDENETAISSQRMPEQTLWCAVINLALADALNGSVAARHWLLVERGDFLSVCSLAGISPFSVRSSARRMLRRKPAK